MRIQTNTNALNALRNIGVTEMSQGRSIEKLSSGFRLNRSGDDAAGMSIANSLRSNGRGLQQAQRNASQANSVLQIADGGTQTVSTILDRMKELATESASGNVSDTDRNKVQAEFKSLQGEIDRIVGSTVYQGQKLLGGSFGVGVATTGTDITMASAAGVTPVVTGVSNVSVSGAAASTAYTVTKGTGTVTLSGNGLTQTVAAGTDGTSRTLNFDKLGVSFTFNGAIADATFDGKKITTSAATGANFRVGAGATDDGDNLISLSLGDLSTTGLGLAPASTSVDTYANAQSTLGKIDAAVGKLNDVVGSIGAAQNRLDYATASVNSLVQNVSAAESVIRDVDMAQEYTNYSKLNILQQAGTAMLAQANSSSQSVLQLLRG
ncbi:MAG: flagellin [Gemmatimonadaceae bacterium]